MKPLRKNVFLQQLTLLALLPSFIVWPVAVQANPNVSGANIINGEISFEESGNTLKILQSSNKSIIEWDSFSIGKDQATIFEMGKNGASLNRVTGNGISALDGLLKADGTLWLINPNGIIQGPNGVIDVGGLLLSTLDVSNEAFLNGGDILLKGSSQAPIITHGRITGADGGEIYVVAHQIEINGTIGGIDNRVVMASGGEVLIERGHNGNVFVSPAAGLGHITVGETGTVEGSEIILNSTGSAMALAVQNRGTIRANTSTREGGRILLKSSGGIQNLGTLDASGTTGGRVDINAGGAVNLGGMTAANGSVGGGGAINVAGSSINLAADANVSAVGNTAGGAINIGNTADPLLPSTSNVNMAPGSVVNAGSTTGVGGSIAVNANDSIIGGGTLAATSQDGVGGTITANSANILLSPTSIVDASGGNGGGSVNMTATQTQVVEGTVLAQGGSGAGGAVNLAASNLIVGQTANVDAGGASGGTISATADQDLLVAGAMSATGSEGAGGSVSLTGNNVTVTPTGSLRADGETDGGTIQADAANELSVYGLVSAVGSTKAGGTINLIGDEVTIGATGIIDISGGTDGGNANIGGGFQGNNPLIRNSSKTTVAPGATIRGTGGTGNGGNVAIWSDGETDFAGIIDVSGKQNGGFAEVSGLDSLKFSGNVNTGGELGENGTLLLDPTDIVLGTGGIESSAVATALGSGNVVIHTTGTGGTGLVNVRHNFDLVYDSENDFSIFAHGDILLVPDGDFTTPITDNDGFQLIVNTGGGNVNLVSGWNGVGSFVSGGATTPDLGPNAQIGAVSAEQILNGTFGTWGAEGTQVSFGENPIHAIEFGSAKGQTNIFAYDLNALPGNGNGEYVHIGFNTRRLTADTTDPTVVTGDINIHTKGDLTYTGSTTLDNQMFKIGHGGNNRNLATTSFLGAADTMYNAPLSGNITLDIGGNLTVSAGDDVSPFHVGHGIYGASNTARAVGDLSGNISVTAGNIILARSSANADNSWTMFGHGGRFHDGDKEGEIRINTGTFFSQGKQNVSYTMVGHGGSNSAGNMKGDIFVDATNALITESGLDNSFTQFGHGGLNIEGNMTGNITFNAGAVSMVGGRGNSWSKIGHGGDNVQNMTTQGQNGLRTGETTGDGGTATGNIDVTVGSLSMLAGDREDSFAHIGHGGTDVYGSHSGNINVTATSGDITMSGVTDLNENSNRDRAFALIGHGGHASSSPDAWADSTIIVRQFQSVDATGTPLWVDPNDSSLTTTIGFTQFDVAATFPDFATESLIDNGSVAVSTTQSIVPNSIVLTTASGDTYRDDGTGRIFSDATGLQVGTVTYNTRVITFIDDNDALDDPVTGGTINVHNAPVFDESSEIQYANMTLQNDRNDQDVMTSNGTIITNGAGGLDSLIDPNTGLVVDPDTGRVMREVDIIGQPLPWQTTVNAQLGQVFLDPSDPAVGSVARGIDNTDPLNPVVLSGVVAPDDTPLYINAQTGKVLPWTDATAAAQAGYVLWDGRAFRQYASVDGSANGSRPVDGNGNLLTPLMINPDTMEILPEGDARVTADFIAYRHGLAGNVTVDAQNGSVIMTAGAGNFNFAKIGHGGTGNSAGETNSTAYNGTSTGGDILGHITVNAGAGSILFDRVVETDQSETHSGSANYERGDRAFVQIGHGGDEGGGELQGDINVTSTGSFEMYGGRERAFAMVGHGGRTDSWVRQTALDSNANGYRREGTGIEGGNFLREHDWDNDTNSEGDIRPQWTRLNNLRGTISGDISVFAGVDPLTDAVLNSGADITFRSGFQGNGAFSQIGHGGMNQFANAGEGHNGNITVSAGGDIDFAAGPIEELNPEGDELSLGLLRPGQGSVTGLDVDRDGVSDSNGFAFEYENQEQNGSNNHTMIGHGGDQARGDHYGLITVTAGNDFRIQATGGHDAIGYDNNNTTTGRPQFNRGNNGSLTGDRNFAQVGHGGVDSEHRMDARNTANALTGSMSRGFGMLGEAEGIVSDISVTAGGSVSVIAAQLDQMPMDGLISAFDIPGNAFLTQGQLHTSDLSTDGLTTAGANGDADTAVFLPDPVLFARNSYAMIGHGGVGNEITSIFVDDGTRGNVTVSANGLIDVRAGDFFRGLEPGNNGARDEAWDTIVLATDTVSGVPLASDYSISRNRGSVDTNENFAMIGHGGFQSSTGTVIGNVSVTSAGSLATDPTQRNTAQHYANLSGGMGLSLQGGNGIRGFAAIGHGGYDDSRSDKLDPFSNDFGNRALRVDDVGNLVQYGYNNGGTQDWIDVGGGRAWQNDSGEGQLSTLKPRVYTGTVTVDVNGGIDMNAGARRYAYASIGHGGGLGLRNANGDTTIDNSHIAVTARQGDITMEGGPNAGTLVELSNGTFASVARDANGTDLRDGDRRWTQIGHGGWEIDLAMNSASNITVEASQGSVAVQAGSHRQDFAMIGHGGHFDVFRGLADTSRVYQGDINVTAGESVSVTAGTSPSDLDFVGILDPVGEEIFTTRYLPSGWNNVSSAFAQIGHGGNNVGDNTARSVSFDGNITVNALGLDPAATGGDVLVTGGDGDLHYALIGHGGTRMDSVQTVTGNVTVNAARDVILTGGERYSEQLPANDGDPLLFNSNNFAQIGHSLQAEDTGTAARRGGDTDGTVSVTALRDISLDGGGGLGAHAIIGNGGNYNFVRFETSGNFDREQRGSHRGDIFVTAGNDLTMQSGNRFEEDLKTGVAAGQPGVNQVDVNSLGAGGLMAAAQIGNGGPGTISGGLGQSGNIYVSVGNDLVMETGDNTQLVLDDLDFIVVADADGVYEDPVTGDPVEGAGGAGLNAYTKIGHGDFMFSLPNESGGGLRSGNINVGVGENATLSSALIGHADPSVSGVLVLEGSTNFAVGRNNPFIDGTGVLTTEAWDIQSGGVGPVDLLDPLGPSLAIFDTVQTSFNSGLIGELRVYLPNRTPNDPARLDPIGPDIDSTGTTMLVNANNSNLIASGTRFNGQSYVSPVTAGTPKLRTSDELYATEFQFVDSETGEVFVAPSSTTDTPTGGLPVGMFGPEGGETINGVPRDYIGPRYTIYYSPPGAELPDVVTPTTGGGGGGGDGGALFINRGNNSPGIIVTLPPSVTLDPVTQQVIGLTPQQIAFLDELRDPTSDLANTVTEWNRIVNPDNNNSTDTAGEGEADEALSGESQTYIIGRRRFVRLPNGGPNSFTIQGTNREFRIYSMAELFALQQQQGQSGSTPAPAAAEAVGADPFNISTEDDEIERRREEQESDAAATTADPVADPFSF